MSNKKGDITEVESVLEEDLSPRKTGEILRRIITPGIEESNGAVDNCIILIDLEGQIDGRVFDNRRFFEYHLGDGCLRDIPEGIELALHHFCVLEKSILTLSKNFAFGEKGHEKFNIPPNATVKYEVKLRSCVHPLAMIYLSLKDKYCCAKSLKKKGTVFFGVGEYDRAHRKYLQSVHYLADIDLSKGKEEFYEFLVTCYLNLALCSLKTNDPSDAISWCNKVLELQPENPKGLYRLGLAHLAKQEPHNARDYFHRFRKVEPDNQAAAKQLIVCDQLEKKVNAMQKQVFMKMFSSAENDCIKT